MLSLYLLFLGSFNRMVFFFILIQFLKVTVHLCAKSLPSCVWLVFATLWTIAHQAPWGSPGKDTGVRCHALLQGIFPAQGSTPRILHLARWQASSLLLAPSGKPCAFTVTTKYWLCVVIHPQPVLHSVACIFPSTNPSQLVTTSSFSVSLLLS